MRWVLIVLVTLLSQACVNQTELAKETLESHVLHSNKITYQKIENRPGKVVCGKFNIKRKAKDSNFNPFIFRLNTVDTYPSHSDLAIFCSPDPIGSLYAATGIRYDKTPTPAMSQIVGNFGLLEVALAQYESDNFSYPKTRQGLSALLHASDISPRPMRFRPGGYLAKLPADPWGRPYLYTGPGLGGGVKGNYIILTLGADGKIGGIDEDADVASNQMKYLLHIERL